MAYVDRPRRKAVEVEVELEDGIVSHRTVTQDIGPGGMFLFTEWPGDPGDFVELRFRLPGQLNPLESRRSGPVGAR